jgi:CheY-like chemotaxis protein
MPEARGRFVLLVDDDVAIRGLLARVLAKAGFEALHAEDGLDALGILRNKLPKVIISDLQMPRMSGFEFIAVVRRRFPALPVIAITGSKEREFAAGSEPDRLFEKRIDAFPELVRAVDELARNAADDLERPPDFTIPVRAGPDFGGCIDLSCTDCLRTFKAECFPGAIAGTAVCNYCNARVPFVIDIPTPEKGQL